MKASVDQSERDVLGLVRQLPGEFQKHLLSEDPALKDAPVLTMLAWFQKQIDSVELRGLRRSSALFDPEELRIDPTGDVGATVTTLTGRGREKTAQSSLEKERKFLRWLATWVSLELDEAWFEEKTAATEGGKEVGPSHRFVRSLIKSAFRLYARRGTAEGLTTVLRVLYGLRTKVLERAWPMGIVIGISSRIGIDCLHVARPARERGFVLLISRIRQDGREEEPATKLLQRLSDSARVVETRLIGDVGDHRVGSCLTEGARRAIRGGNVALDTLRALVVRYRGALERECPAHLMCFVGIDMAEREGEPLERQAMVIGIQSTLGSCYIS